MQSQNPDPLDLLRYSINDLIDRMKAQQQHNLIQDNRLSEHDESIEFLLRKVCQLEYLVGRNQELEAEKDFYWGRLKE